MRREYSRQMDEIEIFLHGKGKKGKVSTDLGKNLEETIEEM